MAAEGRREALAAAQDEAEAAWEAWAGANRPAGWTLDERRAYLAGKLDGGTPAAPRAKRLPGTASPMLANLRAARAKAGETFEGALLDVAMEAEATLGRSKPGWHGRLRAAVTRLKPYVGAPGKEA